MIGGVRLPPPAAVVFVADVARMSAFYCTLFAMDVVQADDAHAVLGIDGLQLTVHALAGADESGPAREDSYLKLCFTVPSIAEARVRAEFRLQFAQKTCDRPNIIRLVRNIIAGQYEHIRPQSVRYFYRTRNVVKAGERAVRNIGKMDDLETVELFRQALELDLDAFEREAVCLVDRIFRYPRDVAGQFS